MDAVVVVAHSTCVEFKDIKLVWLDWTGGWSVCFALV